MEHYLICPTVWQSFVHMMRVQRAPKSRQRVMILETRPDDSPVSLACILFSIRRTVHKLRAKDIRLAPHEAGAHLREAVKIAAAQKSVSARHISSLWEA